MQKEIVSQQLIKLISRKMKEIPEEFPYKIMILKPKVEIMMSVEEFKKFVKELSREMKVDRPNENTIIANYTIFSETYDGVIGFRREIVVYYKLENNYVKIEKIELSKILF